MFTPQEVSEKTFPKSPSFSSGYDLAAVDEFLDTLTEDYTALYKENAALKTKLKILAEKVEEYRATEDTMRSMLLAAQKMADQLVDEAKTKREKMLSDAETIVKSQLGKLSERVAEEEAKLRKAQELGVPVLTEDEFLALLGGKAEDDPENGENGGQLGLFS